MKTRTPVYRRPIEHAAAWTNRTFNGKEGLVFDLKPQHLAAIDELLAKTRHLRSQQVTRHDFDHPIVNELLAELRELILEGRGTVLIRGVTPERYTPEEFERVFWGFGTHWGSAVTQTVTGDQIVHVKEYEDAKNDPHARGYRNAAKLPWHTDAYEIVGLMCLQRAESGGYSRLVSSLAIHNEILKNRPELLEPLYLGVPNGVLETRDADEPVTQFNVPVFCNVDGQVSCIFSRLYVNTAVKYTGVPVPADFDAAMTYMEQLVDDEQLRIEFMIEPGEMLVWNNFVVIHSRTAFEDSARTRRDLLRLWLNVENGRRAIPELFYQGVSLTKRMEKAAAEAVAGREEAVERSGQSTSTDPSHDPTPTPRLAQVHVVASSDQIL